MSYSKIARKVFFNRNSNIFYSILLFFTINTLYASPGPKGKVDRETMLAMIERLMPGKSDLFILKNIPGEGRDSFHLQTQNKKILIEGTNALSMAKGLSYYLKTYCHTIVSWYAYDPVILPKILPEVTKPAGELCRFENRFFMNYCTAGYTTLWWKWNDWQRLIDWMALNGINMPLAIQGQEYIWQKVWRKFGMTDQEILTFFTGPSHLPWQRMGNLDKFLGPLPQSFVDEQFELQKKILQRERAFGMKPILPAFAGHVPKELKILYPNIKITDLGSYDTGPENDAYFLDPMDSIFIEIQKAYLGEQQKLFGTDHFYGADPFNEMDPPSWEPSYLAGVAKNIYRGMRAIDSQAVWVQMGWTFYNDRKHWTNPRLEAMIKAVPENKMVLLDYFCERTEIWRLTDGFFNAPYVWCYLGNFGGNTQLAAPLLKVSKLLPASEEDPNKRNMTGIGATLEGFGVNDFMYDWLFDYAWDIDAKNTDKWIKEYADSRCGNADPVIEAAWTKLLPIIYNNQVSGVGLGNIIQSEPMLKGHGYYSSFSNYDYKSLANILPVFLLANRVSKSNPNYLKDLARLEKQVLVNLAVSLRDSVAKAYYAKDEKLFQKYTGLFISLCDDVDALVSTQHDLLLGDWIYKAREFGSTEAEKNYYEKDARVLITTWGGEDNVNTDYAAKDWSGLISSYYKPRWKSFFIFLKRTINQGTEPDMKVFNKQRARFDWQWTLGNKQAQSFITKPSENTYQICEDLYKKWALFL
jgi:alpha-N-acetylglucosaminidase